jgi:ATPase subunit of ABC transporter with duplicated ATPase domains
MARVEQHLPDAIYPLTMLDAVLAQLSSAERDNLRWKAETLLAGMGFTPEDMALQSATLSGGQHTRLLLARALISDPDLLLLDEPSNHLDLPTMLWLEQFLQRWSGSFVLVSHDRQLLDAVTNGSWILRDKTLHYFALPCSAARKALVAKTKAMRNAIRLNKGNRPHHDQRQTAGNLGQGLRQRRSGPQSQTDGKTGRAAEREPDGSHRRQSVDINPAGRRAAGRPSAGDGTSRCSARSRAAGSV